MNTKEKMLSSLLSESEEFERLKKAFQSKLKVTKSFKSKEEFIKQEIDRIQNEFLEPIKISLGKGDFKLVHSFNYTDYLKYGYEWLSKGQDYELKAIYSNAEKQYLENDIVKQIFNKEDFEKNILTQLQRGAAHLKYEKFLKSELKSIAKPWWKKVWLIIVAVIVFIFLLVDYTNKSFDLFKNIKSVINTDSTVIKQKSDSLNNLNK